MLHAPDEFPEGTPLSLDIAKAQAKRLRTALLNASFPTDKLVHSQALELIAKTHGFESWGHLDASVGPTASPRSKSPRSSTVFNMSISYICRWASIALKETQLKRDARDHIVETIFDTLSDILNKNPSRRSNGVFQGVTDHDLVSLFADTLPKDTKDREVILDLLDRVVREITVKIRQSKASFGRGVQVPLAYLKGQNALEGRLDGQKKSGISPFVDRRHSLIVAPDLGQARRCAYALSDDVLDLTSDAFDSRSIGLYLDVPTFSFSIPEDALTVTAGLRCGYDIDLVRKDITLRPRKADPMVILLAFSQFISPMDVFLAQARAIGFHICIWLDEGTLDDKERLQTIKANTRSVISCNQHDQHPIIWAADDRLHGFAQRRREPGFFSQLKTKVSGRGL